MQKDSLRLTEQFWRSAALALDFGIWIQIGENMIVEVAEFLSSCPHLMGERVNVNFLGKNQGAVSLEMLQKNRVVRTYADGGSLRAATFLLALRENFGLGNVESTKISKKCNDIVAWVQEQSQGEKFPKTQMGATIVSIDVPKGFEAVRADNIVARYEAEIEVVYYKK
jgi:hypothetical protein